MVEIFYHTKETCLWCLFSLVSRHIHKNLNTEGYELD